MAGGRVLALTLAAITLVAACSDDESTTSATTTVDLGPDTGDGVLALGTGQLRPAEQTGVELARRDVDAAGGVLDEPLELSTPDDGVDAVLAPDPVEGA